MKFFFFVAKTSLLKPIYTTIPEKINGETGIIYQNRQTDNAAAANIR